MTSTYFGLALAGGAALVLLVAPLSAQEHNDAADRLAPGSGAPFAVVELFTSQGCSSCPPADAVLRRLERERARTGARIIPLSFHVDYWNGLGWRDPFSDPEFSARQRRYARAFGTTRVYTPQAVINGTDGLVGSRQGDVLAHVRRALERPAPTSVELEIALEGGALTIRHAARGAPRSARTLIAVVESGLSSRVTRGENRGRRLRHDNVVRLTRRRPLSGSFTLSLPRGLRASRAAVVALVSDARSHVILGAARAPLRAAP